MNLRGIQNTNLDERHFWKFCGTIALLIVLAISLMAFKHRLLSRVIVRRGPGQFQLPV